MNIDNLIENSSVKFIDDIDNLINSEKMYWFVWNEIKNWIEYTMHYTAPFRVHVPFYLFQPINV